MAVRAEIKRSVTLAGHRTSISLEREFWDALKDIAAREGLSQNALIARIDAERVALSAPALNLSRAVRIYILRYFRGQLTGSSKARTE